MMILTPLTDTFVINASDPQNNLVAITYTVSINANLAPELTVPVHEWYSCSENSDCSAASTGCCSCDYTAVASSYLDDYLGYYPAPDCSDHDGNCFTETCFGVGCTTNGVCVSGLGGGTASNYISFITEEDTAFSGTFSATDPEGDTISYSVATGTGAIEASKGTVTITDSSTGAFTYTPNANVTGTDIFSITASETNGDQSDIKDFRIKINPVDDVPIVADKSASGNEGAQITIVLTGTDADNPNVNNFSFQWSVRGATKALM